MQEVEDKWRLALDAACDGMWEYDLSKDTISFSNKWYNLLGYPVGEIATSADWSNRIHPDDLPHVQKTFEEYLTGKHDIHYVEMRCRHTDGTYKWVLSKAVVTEYDTNGKPLKLMGIHSDINPRKLTEQLLLEQKNEIDKKNDELKAVQADLLNKVKQLEQLSYIIAHDLRGPANNIRVLAETLKINQGGKSDDESALLLSDVLSADELAWMIGNAGSSLLNTLETLLSIAEIRLNSNIRYEQCNINEYIKTIRSQLKGLIIETNATIITDFELTGISYPSSYLQSILYNLVSNAIKYRSVNTPPVIIVTTKAVNNKTVIIVQDNGLGIDMEAHGGKVFGFHQVFHKGKDSKGVGLYLVKTQVESLGGSISVESEVDKGSVFTVTL